MLKWNNKEARTIGSENNEEDKNNEASKRGRSLLYLKYERILFL